jgi:hypothetical protein
MAASETSATKEHSPAPDDSSIDVVRNQEDGARVTARTVVALSWALITGLAGGWLVLSPWALGERTASGDWTPVAKTEFVTGLGLVVLAVACLAVIGAQVVSALAPSPQAEVGSGPAPAPVENGAAADSTELETTLIEVARALTADLTSRGSAELADARREQA